MTQTKGIKAAKKYEKNPSIKDALESTRKGARMIGNKGGNSGYIVSSETGEQVGAAFFATTQEVDKTKFIKLYAEGIKSITGLSGTAMRVFEVVCWQVSRQVAKDKIYLHYSLQLDDKVKPILERTFWRGLSELVDKDFLYPSTEKNHFFINVNYLFNGDRLAFVQAYYVGAVSSAKTIKLVEQVGEILKH
jgi:hypothetical protein